MLGRHACLVARCVGVRRSLRTSAARRAKPTRAPARRGGDAALAAALAACGQALNVAIYAAIGKDGVYYGFKLGRPVPWCDGFPFNLGFRHPQYVGGLLTQLGLLALASDERSLHAGLAPLAAWWVLLYVATSVQEALGDNDKSD